jgi:2-C-methyl-D-erythritol 2,4-cyclodiphosphate synthase
MKIRTGFGFDVHQLKPATTLILGGVAIPHSKGALGHSDADVLIHAICDALLGAAALPDIGTLFPDTSEKYKGIDSKLLLQKVKAMLDEKGYHIGNIDTTVCLQNPKISPHIPEMKKVLAGILGIRPDDISIKATTTEKLGFVGREEGLSAYAVVMITL